MKNSHFRQAFEGHRVSSDSNRDITNKLTYQQLLTFNHDLSRENQQLKNISNRLGNELRNLHTQFDIHPREENVQLYHAINSQPVLQKYELTLIPLLDTYEEKIQQFEHGFQNINQEFINLEKKYEEATLENQRLRAQLTDKIVENIEIYRNCSSEKLGGDFSQIILQQINEKQKILVEENTRLDKESLRFKAESQKYAREIAQCKKKLQESTTKVKRLEGKQQQLEKENKFLKEDLFKLQTSNNDIENERKKVSCDLEKAQSQITFLSKNKDGLLKNIQRLRVAIEQKENYSYNYGDNKSSLQSKSKNTLQEIVQPNDDNHKKLFKLQKDYDNLLKERNKLKEQLEQSRGLLDESNDRISQIKKRFDDALSEKNKIEASEFKTKKLYEKMIEKNKEDIERRKRQFEDELDNVKSDHNEELRKKSIKINTLEKSLQEVNLEKSNLVSEKALHALLENQDKKVVQGKENDRQIGKLNEKLALNEELFKEQIQIIENDYDYVKKELEKIKADNKEKADELRKTKQELQKTKKQLGDVFQQKSLVIEEIKRIRNEYEGNLKEKQKLFDQKIREIKMIVQQSDRRRKADKEKVAQASRQFKRVLEDIRNTYEERIKFLENEQGNSKVRKNDY